MLLHCWSSAQSFSVVQLVVKTKRQKVKREEGVRGRQDQVWGRALHIEDDDRKIQKQWGPSWKMRRQFLSSSGLEERQPDPRKEHLHIYCLHWIMGLADSSETLQSPPVPPPSNTHTHTPQLLSPKALRCG